MTSINDVVAYTLDQLMIGVVVVDISNNIVLFNRAAGLMLNEKPEERLGTNIRLCHPEKSEPVVLKMIEDIKSGILDHYEGWINYRGRMLYEYIYPLRDSSHKYIGMVEELHDAAEKAELLGRLGEFKELHESGTGYRSPRQPINHINYRGNH